MDNYETIIHDIKCLKIQGAINVAISAVKAFENKFNILYKENNRNIQNLVKELLSIKEELFSLRSTEPALRNALNKIFYGVKYTLDSQELKNIIDANINEVKKHFSESKKLITKFGSKRISNGMTIFTHCHASTVTAILIEAAKNKINFDVCNTETRPLFQGRITAKELSDNEIKVQHFVDSAGRIALKKCDLMLIGADAILSDGTVINKIGSEMFAEIANRYDINVYICTDSWKFDPETIYGSDERIEIRDQKEIWNDIPKNVTVKNYAFEKINSKLITGIISELGIYKPDVFVSEVLEKYPWMRRN